MRPQQQNRRMRGRNNNNNNNNNNNRGKGGPNPLTRSYESNGPDVKIRGNAQQIAEKYTTLARDATSSGDRVMAENYLQHAEHYNRIIAAAQASMPIQNFQQNRDDFDDEDGEDRDDMDFQGNGGEQPQQGGNGSGPQPVIEGMPAEVALNGETGGEGQNRNRDNFRNREGRNRDGRDRNRDFQNRNGNGDYQRRDFNRRDDQRNDGQRNDGQRNDGQRNDGQRNDGQRGYEQRGDQSRQEGQSFDAPPSNEQSQPVARQQVAHVEDAAEDSLPAFLTGGGNAEPVAAAPVEAPRKVRRPRKPREAAPEAAASEGDVAPEGSSGESLAPVEG